MIRRLIREESGYSLVEVMVSIMISAIAIIPMISMFDMGLNVATRSGTYDRGRALAVEQLEEIRALPFSGTSGSLVDTYPPGSPRACAGSVEAGFACQVETNYVSLGSSAVTADPAARTMIEVEVSVTWSGGSGSYSTTGLITKETR